MGYPAGFMRKKIPLLIALGLFLLALATPCLWLARVNGQKRLNQALFDAANKGTGAQVGRVLQAGAWVDVTRGDVQPVYVPIPCGGQSSSFGTWLFKMGVTVTPNQPYGREIQPIHYAAENADVSGLQCLLARGANAMACGANHRQPLHHAARAGRMPALQCLLAAGGKVDVQDDEGIQPIHDAAGEMDAKAMQLLVDAGAKIDAVDKWGRQPIHCAAYAGNVAVLRFLLDRGAKADAADGKGVQPLHLAVGNLQMEAVQLLLASGAPIDAKDNEGEQPIHWALRGFGEAGKKELILRLVAAGAKVSSQNGRGLTLLDQAKAQHYKNAWITSMYRKRPSELEADLEKFLEAQMAKEAEAPVVK